MKIFCFKKKLSNDNLIKIMRDFCIDNNDDFVGVLGKWNISNWESMISKFDKDGNVIFLKKYYTNEYIGGNTKNTL